MTENKKLKIGVHNFKPVVFKKGEKWTGFEIELWEKIAQTLNIEYEFVENKNFSDLLSRISIGEYDIAMVGITRTIDRAKKLRMSFFTLNTGLGIAVIPTQVFSVKDLLEGVFSRQTMIVLIILVLFALVTANIYWFIESGLSVSGKYIPGVFESFWWSIVTFSTVGYGDISPVSVAGRIFGIFSILFGLAIFGLYIGQVSASLTLTKMKSKILSVDDFVNKKIGVKFESLKEAYNVMKAQAIDAVVADLPVLQDQIKEYGFILVGGAFARQAYSFVLPKKQIKR